MHTDHTPLFDIESFLFIKFSQQTRLCYFDICTQKPPFSADDIPEPSSRDLGMAVDPVPPGGILTTAISLYYNIRICHKMRHVSYLSSVALSCSIKITYVTLKMLNKILVPMLKYS